MTALAMKKEKSEKHAEQDRIRVVTGRLKASWICLYHDKISWSSLPSHVPKETHEVHALGPKLHQ